MNIGILTYHDGPNHGAYLQALASVLLLQSWGYEVEIINYKNPRHKYLEEIRPWFVYRRPVRFLDHLSKHGAFREDRKIMPTSRRTHNPDTVKKLHYDAAIIGSDVVWNHQIFGYDDLYFGGLNVERIIAYAPSCGWVNAHDSQPADLSKAFSRFSALSARDENTRELIRITTGQDVPLVLDPTLLTDFSEVERPSRATLFQKPYLLVYAYTMSASAAAEIREYARENKLITIATGYRQDWCDHNRMEVGPLAWLSLVRNAHTLATSTFHGMVFTLKYQTPFFFFSNAKARHRVASLAGLCGMEGCLPETDGQLSSRTNPWDFLAAEKLESAADWSRTWLQDQLSSKKP